MGKVIRFPVERVGRSHARQFGLIGQADVTGQACNQVPHQRPVCLVFGLSAQRHGPNQGIDLGALHPVMVEVDGYAQFFVVVQGVGPLFLFGNQVVGSVEVASSLNTLWANTREKGCDARKQDAVLLPALPICTVHMYGAGTEKAGVVVPACDPLALTLPLQSEQVGNRLQGGDIFATIVFCDLQREPGVLDGEGDFGHGGLSYGSGGGGQVGSWPVRW